MQNSHLRYRVECRNPALNVGSQVGSNFHPRWERWDPTTKGEILPFPPGILSGIAGILPISHLTFYLGNPNDQNSLQMCSTFHFGHCHFETTHNPTCPTCDTTIATSLIAASLVIMRNHPLNQQCLFV